MKNGPPLLPTLIGPSLLRSPTRIRGAGATGAFGNTATIEGAAEGIRSEPAAAGAIVTIVNAEMARMTRTADRMAEPRGTVHANGVRLFTRRERARYT